MKLSVFVVTYNQEKYIRQCLDGILMQEVDFDYEVVIGEDHGTDGTRAICEEYAQKYPQIRLLPLMDNLGIVKNWKRVLSECTGEYVAMCEGDDYWTDSKKLQKQLNFMESHREFSICCHNVKDLDIRTEELVDDRFTHQTPERTSIYDLSKGNYIRTVSVVFRNDGCVTFINMPLVTPIADFPLFILLSREGYIYKMNDCMAVYRDGGVWSNGNLYMNNTVMIETCKNLLPIFKDKTVRNNLNRIVFRKSGFVSILCHYQRKYLKEVKYLLVSLFHIQSYSDVKTFIKNYLLKIGSKDLIESLS